MLENAILTLSREEGLCRHQEQRRAAGHQRRRAHCGAQVQRHVCSGSTESGRIKVFSLATGGEVLKSDVQWTDGSSAFDCCFGQKETLICCAPKEKSGRLTILSFDNDMAAPTVKCISACDTGDYPMDHVAMSDDGTMAACASERGTYVYVVSVAEGKGHPHVFTRLHPREDPRIALQR